MGVIILNDESYASDFVEHLSKFIGETVTIYTTSGGQSGQGVTGVILAVNDTYVRLITSIGPAPACVLGSACPSPTNYIPSFPTYIDPSSSGRGCCSRRHHRRVSSDYSAANNMGYGMNTGFAGNVMGSGMNIGNNTGFGTNSVGAVADIPIDRIAQFIHNAV